MYYSHEGTEVVFRVYIFFNTCPKKSVLLKKHITRIAIGMILMPNSKTFAYFIFNLGALMNTYQQLSDMEVWKELD